MKYQKTKNGQYILKISKDYYLVNETTKFIMDNVDKYDNLSDFEIFIAQKYSITQDEAHEYIKHINSNLTKTNEYKLYSRNKIPELKLPLSIQWRITDKCNLLCKHCYIGESGLNKLEKICDEKTAFEIAQKIIDASVMNVTLTGGEILTVPYIDKLIQFFNINNVDLTLFTNATLTKKLTNLIDVIKNKNNIIFNISIDGPEKIHDSIRGHGNYKKTYNNIKMLIDNGFTTNINFVINKLNYKYMPEVSDIFTEMGVNEIQWSHMTISGNASQNCKELEMTSEDYDNLLEILKNYFLNEKKSNVFYFSRPEKKNEALLVDKESTILKMEERWKCSAGQTKFVILPNLDVTPCSFLDKHFKLGNIKDSSIQDLWNSPIKKEFIEFLNKNSDRRECPVIRGILKDE